MNKGPQLEPTGSVHPGMRIRKTSISITDPGAPCPECGAPLASDAVLCVRCGLNVQTGQKRKAFRPRRTLFPKKMAAPLLAGAAVVAAMALVPRAWGLYQKRVEALTASKRAFVLASVNQKAPLFLVGETVTLRRVDGAVCTGLLCGYGPGGALIDKSGGRPYHITLQQLDAWTKIQLDEKLRNEFIAANAALPSDLIERARLVLSRTPPSWTLDLSRLDRSTACASCAGAGMISCDRCGGRGSYVVGTDQPCSQCGGSGQYAAKIGAGKAPCPFCKGRGVLAGTTTESCETCGGGGKLPCAACAKASN